jgi:hypothetical protein
LLHLLTAGFGTFLPFVALQHHGGYRGHRRHFADGAGRPSLTDSVEKVSKMKLWN